MRIALAAALTTSFLLSTVAIDAQQGLTLPPSGDNQKASVTQFIGPVKVKITYNSPDITAPNGTDRRGKIWGQLVPYGLQQLNFGSGNPAPWRAGANENTVFSVSHDVLVGGKPLPAGSYGLFMIPSEDQWTVIFSNNSTSWGSYFYDETEDALRITTEPTEHAYTHWLNYEFIDRQPDRATVALQWDELAVPFEISLASMTDVYVDALRKDLRTTAGFNWQSYQAAAQYCLTNDTHLEQGLEWAEKAVALPGIGQENFSTLQTKGLLLSKLDRNDEADEAIQAALAHPSASIFEVHTFARQLIRDGQQDKALEVFRLNAKKNPGTWPTDFGLARGYSAVGQFSKALEHARIGLGRAPDEPNRKAIEVAIASLEAGQDIN